MSTKGEESAHLDRDRIVRRSFEQAEHHDIVPVANLTQVHRMLGGPDALLKPGSLLALQRTIGNSAVQRMLAEKRPVAPTAGLLIMRTVDTMANELFAAKKGQPLVAGDTAVSKLKAHGLVKGDKAAVVKKYYELLNTRREEARSEATGIVTWAELTSILTGNSGGQSYYKWKSGDYPHVSVEWTNLDSNPKGPKQIKKIHVSFLRVDGPKYWWNLFSKGVGTYSETSGPQSQFTAGMRDEANEAVKNLILPLHINPGPIPATQPG